MKNKKYSFEVVGLTEIFDETLILFKQKLGWKEMPIYVKQNTSNKPKFNFIEESSLNLIRNKNHLDLKLYQYANEIFEHQLRNQGHSFEKDVEKLIFLNKLYRPIGKIYSMARLLNLNIKSKKQL